MVERVLSSRFSLSVSATACAAGGAEGVAGAVRSGARAEKNTRSILPALNEIAMRFQLSYGHVLNLPVAPKVIILVNPRQFRIFGFSFLHFSTYSSRKIDSNGRTLLQYCSMGY